MGSYIPTNSGRKRSVEDTIQEAERELFLDSPNADFLIRGAAGLLDFILYFLLFSALIHVSNLIGNHVTGAGAAGEPLPPSWDAINWSLKVLAFYVYYLWPVSIYGASPAKQILGLKIIDRSTGELLSLPRVFLRELIGKPLSLLLGIGLLLPLFRGDRKAFHDLISGSVVKRVVNDP